ncbi:hypothetical protein [Actinoplanes sp. NPDC051859]|uniref:hypothetical protein n=1 Tax=Actinoplanes sp. NPDC051859 TaxID=3363909 RepID=UPI0037B8B60F
MRFFSNDARESADEQAHDDRPERVQSEPVAVPGQRPPSPWSDATADDTRAGADPDRTELHQPGATPRPFGGSSPSEAAEDMAGNESPSRTNTTTYTSHTSAVDRDDADKDIVDVPLDDHAGTSDRDISVTRVGAEDRVTRDHQFGSGDDSADTIGPASSHGRATPGADESSYLSEERIDSDEYAATPERELPDGTADPRLEERAPEARDVHGPTPDAEKASELTAANTGATGGGAPDAEATGTETLGTDSAGAPIAGSGSDATSAPQANTADATSAPQANTAGAATAAPSPGVAAIAARAETERPTDVFFAADEAQALQERWREVQLRFVDSPKEATSEAATLVDEAVETLTASLRARKEELGGDSDDTEALRVQLRGYRDILNRILGL